LGPGDARNPLSRYTVYITLSALREIKGLPGHMRQRVKRAIDSLADTPHPPGSEALSLLEMDYDVWRLRLDKWRIVYAITESDKIIDVLAVRKRPPYDYGDLERLLADL
jgi:mRNA interferase RelE/StbE